MGCEERIERRAAKVMQHARRHDDVRRLCELERVRRDEPTRQHLFFGEAAGRCEKREVVVGADELDVLESRVCREPAHDVADAASEIDDADPPTDGRLAHGSTSGRRSISRHHAEEETPRGALQLEVRSDQDAIDLGAMDQAFARRGSWPASLRAMRGLLASASSAASLRTWRRASVTAS